MYTCATKQISIQKAGVANFLGQRQKIDATSRIEHLVGTQMVRNFSENKTAKSTSYFDRDFSRINVFPKLTISNPGDPVELEADSIADEVMRIPENNSSLKEVNSDNSGSSHQLSRKCHCTQCKTDENDEINRSQNLDEDVERAVSRKIKISEVVDSQLPEELTEIADNNEPDIELPVAAKQDASLTGKKQNASLLSNSINTAIKNSGQPLPIGARKFMEPRFGHDFSSVRVHTDSTANTLAQQLQARAFATGNNIFFSAGEFQPEHDGGKKLLAHELAHVVQQGKGGQSHIQRIQRKGNGCMNCQPYCAYNAGVPLPDYNCSGLAHRLYTKIGLSGTKGLLSAATPISASKNCDSVGVIKHWLWEYDVHIEDSSGNVSKTWHDFHTVAGPTDGDPLPSDPDEVYSKNGARKVYGPGSGPAFKPPSREPSTKNDPAETPDLDSSGKQNTKVRSNMTESCFCLPCPPVKKSP
jgi:hypothetical protein